MRKEGKTKIVNTAYEYNVSLSKLLVRSKNYF